MNHTEQFQGTGDGAQVLGPCDPRLQEYRAHASPLYVHYLRADVENAPINPTTRIIRARFQTIGSPRCRLP